MKKTIYSKYDKKRIADLPVAVFPGRVIVVLSSREADKAVDYLLCQSILGIDTETRPSFKKGHSNQVSLLQVSTHDTCFLFRLNHTGLTPAIIRLLEDKTVPKIGLSLHDDIAALHRKGEFQPGSFVDLQKHVGEIGVQDLSLQKLYANFFGKKISKSQQLTNWESDVLNEKQKAYAATDAWACIMLYEELIRLEQSGDYDLVVVEDEPTGLNAQPAVPVA
jgi:ribonuclease D